MKIVFFGTPDYVLPILNSLNKSTKKSLVKSTVSAVVTQKPKLVGRKHFLQYSPVDTWAHKRKIPIFFDCNDLIKSNIKADLGILASYGEIIQKKVLDYFPYGILNVHPSFLPIFRGSSPVQATIITNSQAGASIIKLDYKLDHGPIISQFKADLLSEDTTETLRQRLFEKSAEVLKTLIPAYIQGKIRPKEQDHKKASFTREIKKEDAFIPSKYLNLALQGQAFKGKWHIPFIKDYSLVPSVYSLERFVRAMQPWPQAWTYVDIEHGAKDKAPRRLKILKSHFESSLSTNTHLPSTKLVLDEVQLEGKNPVSWQQFKEGYPNVKFG